MCKIEIFFFGIEYVKLVLVSYQVYLLSTRAVSYKDSVRTAMKQTGSQVNIITNNK